MKSSGKKVALGMMTAVMIGVSGVALAADTVLKGMIVSRDGPNLVVRVGGADTRVMLTESTKIRGTSGGLGARSEAHPPSDLMRGLAVQVTAEQEGNVLTAKEITFKNKDLKVAQQIAAGIAATETRVSESEERIGNVGEMVAVDRTKILFPTGSAVVSAKGKEDLRALVAKAKTIKGYRLIVVGRADSTGNAAANQRLSERRAAAVIDYLLKSAGVLPDRILPAAAVGSSQIAEDPSPPTSAADARRVTVTIVVSKSAANQ